MRCRFALAIATWLLIAPPEIYDAGMPRRDDRQPLARWDRLGTFDHPSDCRRYRVARIAAARDDTEWALFSLARCFSAERARGGPLSAVDDEPL